MYATTAYVCVYYSLCIFTVKVSSDEQFVRRATPLSEPDNIDERTLYVVSLNNFYWITNQAAMPTDDHG